MAPIKLDDNAAYKAYKLLTERPLGMKPFGKDRPIEGNPDSDIALLVRPWAHVPISWKFGQEK
ncbi:hypothetical protein VE00_06224 [Pseudogymnoascus sp. WSF 3629]|nr:hypothetical protein VE00_06224 [Pseudogymnoascus sp. WSF 3629]